MMATNPQKHLLVDLHLRNDTQKEAESRNEKESSNDERRGVNTSFVMSSLCLVARGRVCAS